MMRLPRGMSSSMSSKKSISRSESRSLASRFSDLQAAWASPQGSRKRFDSI